MPEKSVKNNNKNNNNSSSNHLNTIFFQITGSLYIYKTVYFYKGMWLFLSVLTVGKETALFNRSNWIFVYSMTQGNTYLNQ